MINTFDLKNYTYCPRIIYWYYCAPVKFHKPYKMEWGAQMHEEERHKEIRRKLERYELASAELNFEYKLSNDSITGKVDLLLISDQQYIPVEYKFTRACKMLAHKVQLYAYAWLIEQTFNTTVESGFLYYPRLKELEKVEIKPSHYRKVCDIIKGIQQIVRESSLPDVEFNENKCNSCEFQLFCNDTV